MWPFKSVPKAPPKRLAELEAEIADVQVTLAWLRKSVKDLNGRMSTLQRQARDDAEQSAQDAPGSTNDDQPDIPRPFEPRPVESTAHLARRFRGF